MSKAKRLAKLKDRYGFFAYAADELVRVLRRSKLADQNKERASMVERAVEEACNHMPQILMRLEEEMEL